MNPESKPPARGVQGLSKLDCVTVWFFWWKVNRTMSPTFALTDGGLNFRTPGPPTITSIVAERASWADASRKTEPRAKWRIATGMQNYGRSEGKIKKRPGVTEGPTFNVATPTEKKRRKEKGAAVLSPSYHNTQESKSKHTHTERERDREREGFKREEGVFFLGSLN